MAKVVGGLEGPGRTRQQDCVAFDLGGDVDRQNETLVNGSLRGLAGGSFRDNALPLVSSSEQNPSNHGERNLRLPPDQRLGAQYRVSRILRLRRGVVFEKVLLAADPLTVSMCRFCADFVQITNLARSAHQTYIALALDCQAVFATILAVRQTVVEQWVATRCETYSGRLLIRRSWVRAPAASFEILRVF